MCDVMDIDREEAPALKIVIRSVHPIPSKHLLQILLDWYDKITGIHMEYGLLGRSEEGAPGQWHALSTKTQASYEDKKMGIKHYFEPSNGPPQCRVLNITPAVFSVQKKAIVLSGIVTDGKSLDEAIFDSVIFCHFSNRYGDSSCVEFDENEFGPHIDCISAAGLYHTVIIAADNEGEPHMLFRVAVPIPLANGENAGKPTPQAMDYIYRHCNRFIDKCKQQNPDWPEGICDKKHSGCLIAP